MPAGRPSTDAVPIESPEDVEYLVLGGGGARAVAHFGALAALGDLGYLKRVEAPPASPYQPAVDHYLDPAKTKAIAGSSTGGFVATLLAMGVGVKTAYNIAVPGGEDQQDLLPVVLAKEPWERRHRPTFEGIQTEDLTAPHEALWDPIVSSMTGRLAGEVADVGYPVMTEDLNIRGTVAAGFLGVVDDTVGHGVPQVLIDRVLGSGDMATYVRNLVTDYGLFSGHELRHSFGSPESPLHEVGRRGEANERAARRAAEREHQVASERGPGDGTTATYTAIADLGNLTFSQFAGYVHGTHSNGKGFRTPLALTGTNVATRSGEIFSADLTPDVPVADALRMTMAFPLLLKPTFVEDGSHEGIWVDGSIANAYPLHAFDGGDGLPGSVLGFDVGPPRGRSVDSFVDLARAVAGRFVEVSTTGRIRGPRDHLQTIGLPVGDLPYLSVPKNTSRIRPALVASAQAVYEYFGKRRAEQRASTTVNEFLQRGSGGKATSGERGVTADG
ncbi:patatin-like phospholipase family protein [Halovenus rubra]|uniref:Patatin-like phospholipase family protein n=2 Tax=Halovenus rubra TaxID=869890 RepID=A0ABD5XHF8_9EURY|nr:patatin-like phospholipase family protein [Halovenus rubra]